MPASRRTRYGLLFLILYLTLCTIGGIYLADGTLHPARRELTENEITAMRDSAHALNADLTDATITTPDHRHSQRIHARAPNTDLWEVPNADHCGALSTSPQEFEHRLLAWFKNT